MNRRSFISKVGCAVTSALAFSHLPFCSKSPAQDRKPNILWIFTENMSPHWSCYGEKTIETLHVDRLAREGIRYTQAFATSSVPLSSYSALISGLYQTRTGAHHHRSQWVIEGDSDDSLDQNSDPLPFELIPELFKKAGYFTVFQRNGEGVSVGKPLSSSDYSSIWSENVYDADDWSLRRSGQPFFAQIQYATGKESESDITNPVNPNGVQLPPYYPDHPVLQEDWARYLSGIVRFDREVGKVIDRLTEDNAQDDTLVFLFSINGINHLRGRGFLYDEGIRVPLIIWGPKILSRGKTRHDPVSLIDVSVTSLELAGIPIPNEMDGQRLLGRKYQRRAFVASARDRCDETVDCIRSIRTEQVKYIRNYFSDRPYMQSNQARDHLTITQTMKKLYHDDQLLSVQSQIFSENRPPEELYIFYEDPYEVNNLAPLRRYSGLLNKMRRMHIQWMHDFWDLGLIPEPILEEMGREYGNTYFILQREDNRHLIDDIRKVIEWGENGESSLVQLSENLSHPSPAVRFRAAYAIGNRGVEAHQVSEKLQVLLSDGSSSVQIAAARGLCLLGFSREAISVLRHALRTNTNCAVRHYAALFFDDIGEMARPYLSDFEMAQKDQYEPVCIVAQRLVAKFENV
ncbi:sulfatase-like hydrolase/transferase [bacterium]|nr:sulfatase-like hydrolase/transferase [bacterium]RQV98537.1 MAG: hypothetical protein EH221_01675 [bacterium]